MTYGLKDFCADARNALTEDPGTAGRQGVAKCLEKLLANRDFVASTFDGDAPPVKELYRDPDFGFRVLAHTNRKPSKNSAHDHGPSWAVYGMAMNFTDMTEYKRADDGVGDSSGDTATVEKTKEYRLEEGKAVLFDTGVIHRLSRPLETRLIRVTGADLETVLRHRFDVETGEVTAMPPTKAANERGIQATQ